MNHKTVPALVLAMALVLPAALASSPGSADEITDAMGAAMETARFHQLLEDFFEENLQWSTVRATSLGDPRYNDAIPNFIHPEIIKAAKRSENRWLAAIRKIDRNQLSAQDRLSYDVFIYDRENAIEGFRYPSELIPINQLFGLPSFFAQLGSGASIQPFRTEKDYQNWLARMEDAIAIMDQSIANMRMGIERGVVQPRSVMEKVLPQLSAHFVDDKSQSVFYKPVADMPENIIGEARRTLEADYRSTIADKVIPAYRRLHSFIKDEYLPRCRATTAWSDLPDGKAWYAYQVRTMTTSNLTPDEIHEFGLSEVARIQGEMREVMKEVGFEGEVPDFFKHLKESDEFYYTSKEDLLQGYRDLREKINALLPTVFDIFPKADYEIKEVPEFMAPSTPVAFYQPGTPDGSRPGAFFVNTFDLKAQAKFLMESLSIHEASPGHHFQVSIAQEVKELPRFRRFGGTSAYFEGWALYAESLGKELGLFTDPYKDYGRLSSELLRAMRLVVDTGLHHKGWSREKAIAYMVDNSSMAEPDVVTEVERYIVLPGQALAYKVGQRVISTLRARAEKELGNRFDIKAFHRAILIDGALPLTVLEREMDEWLAAQKQVSRARP
jgi:uncharacterized protein (DUF885 family)